MLVWCWYRAFRFAHMRRLVLAEVDDGDIAAPRDRVPEDKTSARKRRKQMLYIYIVIREHFGFDPARAIFEPTGPIRQRPEAREKQTSRHWQFG